MCINVCCQQCPSMVLYKNLWKHFRGEYMLIKRIVSHTFYLCTAILTLTIFVAEFSSQAEISTLEKLGLSGLVIVLLIVAGILRNSCLVSTAQRSKTVHNTLWAIFLFYLVYLIWILYFDGLYNRTSLGTDFQTFFVLNTNFVPFVTIHRYLSNIANDAQTGSAILNLVGNLVAFMPMGFFCPLLFRPMKKAWIFVPSILLLLIGAEGLQLLMRVGSCDVDDVILNLLGALLIYGLLKLPIMRNYINRLS